MAYQGFPLQPFALSSPKLWFNFGPPGFGSSRFSLRRHLGLLTHYHLGIRICHDFVFASTLQSYEQGVEAISSSIRWRFAVISATHRPPKRACSSSAI